MKKLIYLFIIIPFLFISCVNLGDETHKVTLKYLNNSSGEISLSRVCYDFSKDKPTLTEIPLGIIPIGESLSFDLGILINTISLNITCNEKKVVQKSKDNAPLFDTTKYECLFYEKVREPNTCYIITAVYQFEFTDEFFND